MDLHELKSSGWRARIGVIVPSSNTTNEVEFNRLAPDGVSFHFTRSHIHRNPSADGFKSMLSDLESSARQLADCNVDMMVYGCTSGSMACPANLLIKTMEESGKSKAISTAEAILKALNVLNTKRLSMATPYSDSINKHEKAYLESRGLQIVKMAGMQLSGQISKVSRVPPSKVYDHALSVNCKTNEAILICCTDFGTLDVIEPLENTTGKPVITSNTASFWHALRTAGINDRIKGYGQLLRNF